jgi:hypothetical protein
VGPVPHDVIRQIQNFNLGPCARLMAIVPRPLSSLSRRSGNILGPAGATTLVPSLVELTGLAWLHLGSLSLSLSLSSISLSLSPQSLALDLV